MFHDGNLQSGISLAIQQKKLVSCFVYQQNDPDSVLWESTYLPSLSSLFADNTVLLKIELSSQEASFLSAFCPIELAPTLAIIDSGKVIEKLEGDIEQSDWETRVKKALGAQTQLSQPSNSGSDTNLEEREATTDATPTNDPGIEDVKGSMSEPTATDESSTSEQPTLQSILPDRAARVEAEHAAREAREKEARIARANAIRAEAEAAAAAPEQPQESRVHTLSEKAQGKLPAGSTDDARKKSRADWVLEQAKRKQEAKIERQRILQQIESDRKARKERDAMAKEVYAPATAMPTSSRSPNVSMEFCALQIRLFDGSSVKTRFKSSTTLAIGVRTWIQETAAEGAADTPYDFRLMRAPNPSRTIDRADEQQTLLELGLVPSATLVLIQAAGGANSSRGFFSGGILGSAYGLASGAAGVAGSALNAVRGWTGGGPYIGGVGDEDEPSNVAGAKMAGADSLGAGATKPRTKTLADQRAETERGEKTNEFYNGNSSAFEGRKRDDNED